MVNAMDRFLSQWRPNYLGQVAHVANLSLELFDLLTNDLEQWLSVTWFTHPCADMPIAFPSWDQFAVL